MVITKFVRRAAKTVFFIVLFCVFARLINSSAFISLDTANAFAAWLHGSASQENYDDLWFFTDVGLSLISAIIAYNIVIKVGRKIAGRSLIKTES